MVLEKISYPAAAKYIRGHNVVISKFILNRSIVKRLLKQSQKTEALLNT